MRFPDDINFLGPVLLAVMLISATRQDPEFNLVKPVLAAFAALVADAALTFLAISLRGSLGGSGAIWLYLILTPIAVMVVTKFIAGVSWKAASIMGAFYIIASTAVKLVLSYV